MSYVCYVLCVLCLMSYVLCVLSYVCYLMCYGRLNIGIVLYALCGLRHQHNSELLTAVYFGQP